MNFDEKAIEIVRNYIMEHLYILYGSVRFYRI